MKLWLSGPRLFNGLLRPGISLGREDFRRMRKQPAITAAGMLGVFRRDDGAIFLGMQNLNGAHENEPGLKPVSAFAFPPPRLLRRPERAPLCVWLRMYVPTA